jgi:hypothetical protein
MHAVYFLPTILAEFCQIWPKFDPWLFGTISANIGVGSAKIGGKN